MLGINNYMTDSAAKSLTCSFNNFLKRKYAMKRYQSISASLEKAFHENKYIYILMYDNVTFAVQDLRSFSSNDITVLRQYYDISTDVPQSDAIWLLALHILSNHQIAYMKPERVWNKYKIVLSQKLSTDSTVPTMDDYSATMQTFQNADPTSNKTYLDWIVSGYVNDGIKRYEDLMTRVLPALKDYDYLKKSKKLTKIPGKAYLDETNILNYCGIAGCKKGKFQQQGLEELIDKHAEELVSRRIQLQETEDIKQEGKTIFEGPNVKIIQPLTEAAACHYGRGTRWCTAGKDGNLFELYNKQGPLYILIPTKARYTGEKYQLHFYNEQYMDEKD
uniref:Uncharacterized protein n=1 Tax=Marseillevirus LCMAC201 TaxID=2506605 RepID=A0A481YX94_9VIRU|nr:MAG: hypothetical protein LCMAC201_04320 [Marseillevirus LCMAC201]